MSLLKRFPSTPARIEANRRNALKTSGPRTPQGKMHSRMNALRDGNRSPLYSHLFVTLLNASPYSVDRIAQALLKPEQSAHPLFADLVQLFRQAEGMEATETRHFVAIPGGSNGKSPDFDERTHQLYENKQNAVKMSR